jgi:hypothetical protein
MVLSSSILLTNSVERENGESKKKDNTPDIGSGDLPDAKKHVQKETQPKRKSTIHIGEQRNKMKE